MLGNSRGIADTISSAIGEYYVDNQTISIFSVSCEDMKTLLSWMTLYYASHPSLRNHNLISSSGL